MTLPDGYRRLPLAQLDADWRHRSDSSRSCQGQRHKLAGCGNRRGGTAVRLPAPRVQHVGVQAVRQRHLGYGGAGLGAFGQDPCFELGGIGTHSRALDGFVRVHLRSLVDTMLATEG